MIDIARAMQPGGKKGDYQIGRGMSAYVFAKVGIDLSGFIRIVATSEGNEDVANLLLKPEMQPDYARFSARLARATVANVPPDLQADFEQFYGTGLPSDMKFFDLLDADDAKMFPNGGSHKS